MVPAMVRAEVNQLVTSAHGHRRLVIRLDPPELGALTIELTAAGDNLAITARTESVEAVRALLRQRGDVQQAVEASGHSLVGFDVHADRDRDQSARWAAGRRRSGQPATLVPDLPERPGDHHEEGAIFL